jgi:DNA-binding MarR family transcriptional regulator
MSGLNAVLKAHDGIERALAAGDWVGADRGIQYMAGAWLRSLAAAGGGELAKVAAATKRLRVRMMTEHDVDQDVGPTELAWMLAGVTAFLSQATKPESLTAHDTVGRILEALVLSSQPMNSTDIATRINRAKATVARKLPDLRAEGLVESTPAGSNVLNRITEAGRAKYRELGEIDALPEPKGLTKAHGRPKATESVIELVIQDRDQPSRNKMDAILKIS